MVQCEARGAPSTGPRTTAELCIREAVGKDALERDCRIRTTGLDACMQLEGGGWAQGCRTVSSLRDS